MPIKLATKNKQQEGNTEMLKHEIHLFLKRSLQIILFLSLLPMSLPTLADVPNFYSEPGLNPYRDYFGQQANELVDPFTGQLKLNNVDLFLPGNGGMDIKVQRTYVPLVGAPRGWSFMGTGWTLHFGRVLHQRNDACNGGRSNDSTDNPIVELPDGGQQLMFSTTNGEPYRYISRQRWKAVCTPASNVTSAFGSYGGLTVTSPDGLQYKMDFYNGGDEGFYAWYVTEIKDRNDNWIRISYTNNNYIVLINQITSSDGRTVNFNYSGNTFRTLLTSITSGEQTWSYLQAITSQNGWEEKNLNEVVRPDGSRWKYEHSEFTKLMSLSRISVRVLSKITYPYGATSTYSYDLTDYWGNGFSTWYRWVISRKETGGRGISPGVWDFHYDFTWGINPSDTDTTTIVGPGGRQIYKHFGLKRATDGTAWKIGTLLEKQTIDDTFGVIQTETYDWDSQIVSSENYGDSFLLYVDDEDARAPLMVSRTINRDGTNYVTSYQNHDAYGNPGRIVEAGNASKQTDITYGVNLTKWLLHQSQTEVIVGQPSSKNISRTFDSNGNVTQITKYGVTDTYGYHSTGDLLSHTNARGRTWTFSDYFRGIPRNEVRPENVTISRVVNNTGTIASETDGRRNITVYTYDLLNRVTSIARPLGALISVTWLPTGQTVTRGGYVQATTFDGVGRPVSINTGGVIKNIAYHALGYKSFESYYSSASGDSYSADVLGRVRVVTHGDGTRSANQYLAGNVVRTTNERGHVTSYTYRSFGDPDNKDQRALMRIDAPEGVSTVFTRDVLGLPTSISQGGITRTFDYNAGNFLVYENNPEIGITNYGRDQVGNMTSRTIGGSTLTSFIYDGLNRLTSVDYPGPTPDVLFNYDGNNNLRTSSNGVTARSYGYDANNNLTAESLTVNGRTFNAAYSYDALDYQTSTIYPSGQVVTFSPDFLGRATTVAPYITNSIGYHPSGAPSDFTYLNGRRTIVEFNTRQWMNRIAAFDNATYVSDLRYDHDGIGNVRAITDALDSRFSRSLNYDGLDRLSVANGVWGAGSIQYDSADNIRSQSLGSFNISYSYANNRLATISGSKPYTFGYDTYGNVTSNSYHNFAYNDASNLTTVTTTGGSLIGTYTYDGNNMRARVQQNGKDTYVFYAKDGKLLGEYDADGRYKEYVYLGARLVAMRGVSPGNRAPIANAGSDLTIGEGLSVTLNGAVSSDPDGTITRYSWRQTGGATVSLGGASTATPAFTAPRVRADTTLTFALYVNDDDYGTASDSVNIIVQNTSNDDDSDGLSDIWETQYFNTLAYGPNDDPDNDGLSNLQENIEGTNPNAAAPMPGRVTTVQANSGISSNTISWQPVTSAASYNVYWSTNAGVTKANGNRISGIRPPYAHSGLTNGTRYYYVVTAQNNSGESAESPEVSAVPSIAPLIPILELLLNASHEEE